MLLFEEQTSNEVSSTCIREHEEGMWPAGRVGNPRGEPGSSARSAPPAMDAPEGLGLFLTSSHWADDFVPLIYSGTLTSYLGKQRKLHLGF